MQVSSFEVKQRLVSGQVTLLDCREPNEFQICRIDGAVLIPMNEIPMRVQEVDSLAEDHTVVVYCHHGVRSLNVANWLRHNGVENVQSMAGGIDDWSVCVDPGVPRY